MNAIEKLDPDVWHAIHEERVRQQTGLEMIASENYTSPAVLAAQGSVLTNKYAEGYPGRRYYGGCEFVDVVEKLAIDRAIKLFGAEHANVQPHSGAAANMGVYFACLEPGDSILAMNLAHGGHLTHGMPLNFSGKLYKIIPYGVRRDTECIDYDEVAVLAVRDRVTPLVGALTPDLDRVRVALSLPPSPSGGSDWADAVRRAHAILAASQKANREIVVLSDNQKAYWADPEAMFRWELLRGGCRPGSG